jgi:hypothetical protein
VNAQSPKLEPRRASDFERQLLARARAWVPTWSLQDGERDFGRALLRIAARLSEVVAERLDGVGEKMSRGFLDWLAFGGKAAVPARLPVVFKLADKALAVNATAPVKFQIEVQATPIVLETETDVRLIPARLDVVVGADPAQDAYFLPPPGLSSLDPIDPLPTQWEVKSFAAPLSTTLQLDPALGLAADTLLEIGTHQYRIVSVKGDLVTIDPAVPADAGFEPKTRVDKVVSFAPFDPTARNWQQHVLYLGDKDLLKLDASAVIDVIGAQGLPSGTVWEYWGKNKSPGSDPDKLDWWPLSPTSTQPDAVPLAKPEGSMEILKLGDTESRWIRARVGPIQTCTPALTTDELSLCINSQKPATTPTTLEAFVNAAPSPIVNFDPLGRAPRLFDTFYLGCAEAFSKPHANVDVTFDLADTSFQALAIFTAGSRGAVVASVDKAGALHLFALNANGSLTRLRDGPLLPSGASPSIGGTSRRPFRPLAWSSAADFQVVIAIGREVWMWNDNADPTKASEFNSLGIPNSTDQSTLEVEGLAAIKDGAGAINVVALRSGKLFIRTLQPNSSWSGFPQGTPPWAPKQIASIASTASDVAGALVREIVVVADNGDLYRVGASGVSLVLQDVATDVGPFALQPTVGNFQVVAVSSDHKSLLAASAPTGLVSSVVGITTYPPVPLETGDTIENTSLDAHVESLGLTAYAIAKSGGTSCVVAWMPFDPALRALVFKTQIDASVGIPQGALTLHDQAAYMPGASGKVLAATYSAKRLPFSAKAQEFITALAAPPILPPLAVGDIVAKDIVRSTTIALAPTPYQLQQFYWLKDQLDTDADFADCYVFRIANTKTFTAKIANDQYKLDAGDQTTEKGSLIRLEIAGGPPTYEIFSVTDLSNAGVATLDRAAVGATLKYWPSTKILARVVPALQFDNPNDNNWDAQVLARGDLYFPKLQPTRQPATAIDPPGVRNFPLRVAMESAWTVPPTGAGNVDFVVDAMAVTWASLIGDNASNPALSWEYWDGNGWSPLKLKNGDPTLNLKTSGTITFEVPSDLRSTDWAGKTDYWIRARLIGGDYGQNTPVVTATTDSSGKTTYRTELSTDGVQAPRAISVSVTYQLDTPMRPTYLVTEDSGSRRDQSDANRTPDARVDIFTPLCATLAKLEGKGAPTASVDPCAPDCDCDSESTSTSPVAGATPPARCAATPAAPTATSTSSRALYLGFSATFTGEPINVLIVVDAERAFDTLAPLKVEGLVGGRFEPVVADDKTRVAGETGVVSIVIPEPPGFADLFGHSLVWLRLKPATTDATLPWAPSIRGVYVNAVWARAAETMTRELLGSSVGAPDLTLTLARPPLLHGTLELRVREPLGEEERTALRESDESRVLSAVENLPGDWVRWECVIDPDDYGPTDRVYSLDETIGTVRFGDGLHGMIPPIGRDSIVAFTYQRTEPPPLVESSPQPSAASAEPLLVPANTIVARTSLNLVSPVQGVESAAAADDAGGGAAPEADDRVLRFAPARLWHRNRALTLSDFEELALESSSDIVQAKAFRHQAGVRLVVVMRGATPQPTKAAQRELRSALALAAPAFFAAPPALQIEGPLVRRLRVDLLLEIASLDVSGALATFAERAIRGFFDSATGGLDGNGWALGATPREDDIALALLDAPNLLSIENVGFIELDDAGDSSPWHRAVKANELVLLASDGVRIEFKIVETVG